MSFCSSISLCACICASSSGLILCWLNFALSASAESSSGNKRRSISDKALAGAIRCAYSLRAFENTRLYAELKLYGEENGLSIVAE